MRLFIAALISAFAVASAQAQSPQSNQINAAQQIGAHASRQPEEKSDKPKANDKAYNAALRNLPDKQYDPWHGVR
jgi:hypothetical protein